MSLGGMCLDMFKKLLVVGPGEIDPVVRWVYAVESTHRSSFPRSWRAHCPDRIGEKDDKDAAGSYHGGPPSDPDVNQNEVPVMWRA